jgi:hypothetical protein
MANFQEHLDEAATVAELRSTSARLSRQLQKEKHKNSELVDAVFRAASDSAAGLTLSPVKSPKRDRRKAGEQVAVAVLSDWQLGKQTPSYNSVVCEERIERYADKLESIVKMHRGNTPVHELRVYLLGDIVEGEEIFPGQAHLIDSSLYQQMTVDGPRILCNFLQHMLTIFKKVHVVGVIGNHGSLGGRSRKDYNGETNADRMLYNICRQILHKEKRLSWFIPWEKDERMWYAVDNIGEHGFLLAHGDQIRGGLVHGLAKKTWGWAVGGVPEKFNEVIIGHWHQPTRMTLNTITARVNGSTESDNTYAQEQLAAIGRPSQWLLMVHPKHGVSAEYCVYLDH